jgi:GAF domain-containing protein
MSTSWAGEPEDLSQVARHLVETHGIAPTLSAVVAKAEKLLPCRWAIVAVTQTLEKEPARLTASSDFDLATRIAGIAAKAGASPGITAFESGKVVVCSDLTLGDDYPHYSKGMLDQTPVRSVLSVPLQNADGPLGVLTCYADRTNVFDDQAVEVARTLGDLAVLAIEAALGEDKADNLQMALLRSRTIGAAIGILMERHQLNASHAFKLLERVSQHTNTKLAQVAAELVNTGNLPDVPGSP